ncbi:MAG TPA: DUF1028 domain-containing protein [Nocardioidaceae bacterium]|nr:DUF1028 domain-containing protein [Nocardioidaceae bacterium]
MTFSIVARSPDGTSWGVAVASKFLAVGSVVPAAVAGIGALATQADANVSWKGRLLALLDEGATAPVALERVVADDEAPTHRQVGIVDLDGTAAAHTGADCLPWAGDRVGDGVSLQGNVLAGPEVLAAMEESWHATAPEGVLARRLLAALRAGDRAGGDRRGRQSAALLVVREGAGYGGLDDVAVDLRVDDHPDPCAELERLLDLHRLYLTASTEQEKVPLDAPLRAELEALARATGHRDLAAWVGSENYEMRADLDPSSGWVDVLVLQALRDTAGAAPA